MIAAKVQVFSVTLSSVSRRLTVTVVVLDKDGTLYRHPSRDYSGVTGRKLRKWMGVRLRVVEIEVSREHF